jgi:hypothetical protein
MNFSTYIVERQAGCKAGDRRPPQKTSLFSKGDVE